MTGYIETAYDMIFTAISAGIELLTSVAQAPGMAVIVGSSIGLLVFRYLLMPVFGRDAFSDSVKPQKKEKGE